MTKKTFIKLTLNSVLESANSFRFNHGPVSEKVFRSIMQNRRRVECNWNERPIKQTQKRLEKFELSSVVDLANFVKILLFSRLNHPDCTTSARLRKLNDFMRLVVWMMIAYYLCDFLGCFASRCELDEQQSRRVVTRGFFVVDFFSSLTFSWIKRERCFLLMLDPGRPFRAFEFISESSPRPQTVPRFSDLIVSREREFQFLKIA